MKVYEGREIRNVGLTGHGNSGKTSLAAGMLYLAGATNRLTRVDEGNTVTDFDDDEIQRKITISTALAFLEWNKLKINLLDTPGFNIFINDTKASLVAADSSLVLVDGVAGVEVQTEKVWSFAAEDELPRALVINKLDRENSSFERALASIHENFGRVAVPVQLPLGSERDFRGVIDLVRMKCFAYEPGGSGRGKEQPIPAELVEAAQKAQEALIEMVAEGNDALMEEFFDKGTLPPERLTEGLRLAVRGMRLFPVLCASGLNNIGTDLILDFITEYFPAPTDRAPRAGAADGKEVERAVSSTGPVSAFVFKTVADPF
ncbi:MAG TPA: GTP-binding protein, partial [Bryobacteraceae bacterium]|nr:GTP-binding protein [Bryobacteraceae bacterium]